MRESQITTEHPIRRGFGGKYLLTTFIAGLILGIAGGAFVGWFAHRFYYQQRLGQVLLCQQNHAGLPEVQMKTICGSAF